MKLFPWQKQREFFSPEEKEQLMDAIRKAEQRTSGEVRLFIESRCRFVDALDRAREIFSRLGMEKTEARNAVLVYVAVDDHQVAVFGDEGIHRVVGQQYWEAEVGKMLARFREEHLAEGISLCITDIGDALHHFFPYDRDTDKNELPDDIIFGK
ncbi:TPM domain-containing protein [Paraflavisolibacter sp. H34]|uniref:TPM domain-containing protein n=1 Tax=Huijunlia imazamoxiresistens TaxID=3127457 RepID=UPI00301B0215